ncbi:MAG: hypothetical protein EBU90_07935 [Proteobacteria bacterium]|nr:hypothetical protein [Pseudomonadota bacterium]NBP15088.1 hypothetical protein [bacterium]
MDSTILIIVVAVVTCISSIVAISLTAGGFFSESSTPNSSDKSKTVSESSKPANTPVANTPVANTPVANTQPTNTTCYGANNGICNTCDDVKNAYKGRYWRYDTSNFDQCKGLPVERWP